MGLTSKMIGWIGHLIARDALHLNIPFENALLSYARTIGSWVDRSSFAEAWREEGQRVITQTAHELAEREDFRTKSYMSAGRWPDERRYQVNVLAEYWDIRSGSWQTGEFHFYYQHAYRDVRGFEQDIMMKFGVYPTTGRDKSTGKQLTFRSVSVASVQKRWGYKHSWIEEDITYSEDDE